MLRIGDGSNLKEKILRCPREHRGDCELVPLEKEAPLDDNCQRGCGTTSAGAEICVLPLVVHFGKAFGFTAMRRESDL